MHRMEEQAGALNERITVTRVTLTSDGMGGNTESWSTIATLWACVKPINGRERSMAQQTESPRNYRFTVRRTAGSAAILEKDRITWRGKVMNIRFIADNGPKKQYLVLEAEAGVAA